MPHRVGALRVLRAPKDRPKPVPLSLGRMRPLARERVPIPSADEAELVPEYVRHSDLAPARVLVRLEEPLEPARNLEGLAHAARDDREVVGRVTARCVLPVDQCGCFVDREEDVLPEKASRESPSPSLRTRPISTLAPGVKSSNARRRTSFARAQPAERLSRPSISWNSERATPKGTPPSVKPMGIMTTPPHSPRGTGRSPARRRVRRGASFP